MIIGLPEMISEVMYYHGMGFSGEGVSVSLTAMDYIQFFTYIISAITVLLCGQIALYILPHFAITVASSMVRKLKLLLAFGIGFVIYLGAYFVTITIPITEVIIAAFLPISNASAYFPLVPSMLILAALYAVLAIIGYCVMYYLMHKKLNL